MCKCATLNSSANILFFPLTHFSNNFLQWTKPTQFQSTSLSVLCWSTTFGRAISVKFLINVLKVHGADFFRDQESGARTIFITNKSRKPIFMKTKEWNHHLNVLSLPRQFLEANKTEALRMLAKKVHCWWRGLFFIFHFSFLFVITVIFVSCALDKKGDFYIY